MMDLNDLVPSGSGLVLTAGEFMNDRGEIGASGVLPNGDHHGIISFVIAISGSRHTGNELAALIMARRIPPQL